MNRKLCKSVRTAIPDSLLDALDDAVLILDVESGAICDANWRARKLYELEDCTDFACHSFESLSSGEVPHGCLDARRYLSRAREGETQFFEWRARSTSGRRFWVDITLRAAFIEDLLRLVLTARETGSHLNDPPSSARARGGHGCCITRRSHSEGNPLSSLPSSAPAALGYARSEVGEVASAEGEQEHERALREPGAHFRIILENIDEGVISVDAAGRIKYVNQVAAHLTGWSEHDVEGRPLAEVFRAVNRSTRAAIDYHFDEKSSLRTEAQGPTPYLLVSQDGSEALVSTIYTPIADHDGALLGSVLTFRDITNESCQREILSIFKVALENATDAIGMSNPAGVHYYQNPASFKAIIEDVSIRPSRAQ